MNSNLDLENSFKRSGTESGVAQQPAKKQKVLPPSISQLCDNDRGFELIHFIQILFKLHVDKGPGELPKTVEGLAEEIRQRKDIAPSATTEHLRRLVTNLVSKQFSNPVVESLREIITNALDAQVRAKSADTPLLITFQDNTLTIVDDGDGVGTAKLNYLLVPGVSSNRNALFDDQATIEGNTGRFGQGALSVFHLIMPSDKLYITPPAPATLRIGGDLQTEEGPIKVSNTMTITSPNQMSFEDQTIPLGKKPKISIASSTGELESDPIAIKVGLEKSGIFVDVIKKSFSKSKGTRFKIRSSKLSEKSVREALSYFRFTSRTPIYFNGEWINPPPQDFKTVSVEGARLLFNTVKSIGNAYGEIIIAERGRKICTIHCKGVEICREIVLDFNGLQPSQDRATVNWRDPILRHRLEVLIKAVLEDVTLSVHEKIGVFNVLTGLPRIEGFDLSSLIEGFLKRIRSKLLPNLRTFRDIMGNSPDYYFVDEKLLKKIHAFEKLNWDKCKIYLVPMLSQPAVKVEGQHEVYYLFDKQLFPPVNSSQFILMMQMIEEWIKAAHLNNHPNKFSANLFVRNFFYDDFEKSSSEVVPQIDEEVEGAADFPQAASFQEFQEGAKRYLQNFPESIAKTIVEKFLIEDSGCDIKNFGDWQPHFNSLFRTIIDVHLKASPKIAAVISDRILETGFLDRYISNLKMVYFQFSDESLISDNWIDRLREVLEQRIQMITSYGSNLGPMVSLFYHRYMDEADIKDEDMDRNLVMALTKICERYPIIYDDYSSKAFHIDYLKNRYIDFELLCENKAENIEEFITFFDRFSKEYANYLICLFFFDKLGSSKPDVLNLIRSLSVFDNEFIKFFFQMIEASIHQYYKCASHIIRDVAEGRDRPQFYIPVEVLKDFRNLIYLSKTIPEQLKQNYSIIFFSAYFIQLAVLKKTERASLRKMFLILSRVASSEQMCKRIISDFKLIMKELQRKWYAEIVVNKKSNKTIILELLSSDTSNISPISASLINMIDDEFGIFKSTSFVFPDDLQPQVCPLAEDRDVLSVVGTSEKARQEIAAALRQNLSGYSFIIKELIRNASDAGCKKIQINTAKDAAGNFYVTLSDDGSGMNERAFQALKTPNHSTKNKSEQDSSSYGLGFFSVFSTAAFDEVHVSTKHAEGVERKALFVKRDNAEIFYASEQSEVSQTGASATGTVLILKKECNEESVDVECGIFSLETKMIVSEFLKVPIYFNNALISKNASDEIAFTSLVYPGEVDGAKIVVATSNQGSGIYRENLLIGPVTKNYLSLLPIYIQEYLDKKVIDFKIYLPLVDQVMTRSHVVNSEDVESAIQYGVLWSAIKTIALNLVEEKESKFIPHDYWYDFRLYKRPLQPQLQRVLVCLLNGLYSAIQPHFQKMLVLQFDRYLKENKDRLILPPVRSGKNSEESSVTSHFNVLIENTLENNFQTTILTILNNQYFFTEILCNLPLRGTHSLVSIRNEVMAVLKANQILSDNYDYNLAHPIYLPENRDRVSELLHELFKELIEKLEHPQLKKVLDQFIGKVGGKILKNTVEAEKLDAQLLAFEPVGKFVQIMSRTILNKEITYNFMHAGRDRYAHTQPGTNCIHINVDIEPFQLLPEVMKSIRSGTHPFLIKLWNFKAIAKLLATLAHEVTHMEESVETTFTHDKQFYSKMCSTYERFMMRLAQDESLLIDSINQAFSEA